MNLRLAVFAALCVVLVCGIAGTQGYAQSQITVYNPMGTPPPFPVKAMAPRLDRIDGKTIYLVNTGFPNSGPFMEVMKEWFADNHPKVNAVVVTSMNMTPALRTELTEKADAVFFGLGH